MSNENSTFSIGFPGLLTLIFITLKLAGIGVVANWSWWWVLSPLWIVWSILIIVILILFIFKMLE